MSTSTNGRTGTAKRTLHRLAAQVLLYVIPATSVPVAAPAAAATPLRPLPAFDRPVASAVGGLLPILRVPQAGGQTEPGATVVVGQVLSDVDGRPLAGVEVTVVGQSSATSETDVLGRYSLELDGPQTLVFEKDGFTQVYRVTPDSGEAMRLTDVRLTPLRAPVSVTSAGATLVDGGVTVQVPAGALAATAGMRLSTISAQALPMPLPLGWIPVAAFDLRTTAGTGPSGALGLEARGMPASALVQLARYRPSSSDWVAVATGLIAANGTVSTSLPSEGAFAIVAADLGATGPGSPVIGSPLPASEVVDLPAGIMGTAVVDPAHIDNTGQRATAVVSAQPPVLVPSGSLLEARVVETYTLRGGEVLTDERRYHDVAVFRVPGETGASLTAAIALGPWRDLPRDHLDRGEIDVEIWSPGPRERGTIGGRQAVTLESQGAQLTVAAGSLAEDTSIGFERTAPSGSAPTAMGLTVAAELWLDLSGKVLAEPASLSMEAPAGLSGGTWLLARHESSGPRPGWAVVSLARRELGRIVLVPYAGLPGPRTGGRYAFVHTTSSVGFVDGTLTPVGSGAVVSIGSGVLPFQGSYRADGSYIVAAAAGAAVVQAEVPGSTLAARAEVTVIASQTTRADLSLQGGEVIASVWPAGGAVVPTSVQIEVTAPLAVDGATVTTANVRLIKKSTGAAVPLRFVVAGDGKAILVIPTLPGGAPADALALEYATEYELTATGLRTRTGVNLVVPPTELRTRPKVSTAANTRALTFSFPNAEGAVTLSAVAGSYAPGTTLFVVNDSNGDVVAVTVGDTGAVSETIRATLHDRFQITITDPQGNETSFTRSQFYDAATGRTAIGAGGGVVVGTGGVEAHVPADATSSPVRLKLQALPSNAIPSAELPAMKDASGNAVGHFGGAMKITSEDLPRFKKEVDLVFNKPPDAPDGAFYYVFRRLQGPNGKILWEAVDHAFVEEIDGQQKVVTASYPFTGYRSSDGAFKSFELIGGGLGGIVINAMMDNYAVLMWEYESLLPGKSIAGAIRGTVRRAVWRANVPGQAPSAPEYVPVVGAVVRGKDADLTHGNQTIAVTQPDGTFCFWDHTYDGGEVTLLVDTADGSGQTAEVIAYEGEALNGNTPGLRFYTQDAVANVLLPSIEPLPPPPTLAIHVMQQASIDQGPAADPIVKRLATTGIVAMGTDLLIGFDSKPAVTSVHITGPQLDERYRLDDGTIVPETLPPDSPEPRYDYVLASVFTPPRPGVYTVEAELVPEVGQVKRSLATFLVITGGASRRDPIHGEPPKVITDTVVPRPSPDGTRATGVQLTTHPSVQFTEPVKGFTSTNVTLTDVETGELVPVRVAGVGSDTFGTTLSYEDVMDPTWFAGDDSVTSITVKPLQTLRFRKVYRLTLGPTIVDLDEDAEGQATPRGLEGAPYLIEFETAGPTSLTQPSTEGALGSPALVVMKERAYIVEGTVRQGILRVYDVSNPLLRTPIDPAVVKLREPRSGPLQMDTRILDMVGDPESMLVARPAVGGGPRTPGKLLVVAVGPTGFSRPSTLVLLDVSEDDVHEWVGLASVTTTAPEGYISRVAVRGDWAYTATAHKGLQVVDLKRAIANYQRLDDGAQFLARRKIYIDGAGWGMDAVLSSIDLRRWKVEEGIPVAVGNNLVWDLALADIEVDGVPETIAFTTGEFPLAVVRPLPRTAELYGDLAGKPLARPLADGTGNMVLVSGDAMAYAKLGRRADGITPRDIVLVAGLGRFGDGPTVPVLAVLEFIGIGQPPQLRGMVKLASRRTRDILVYGDLAVLGSEIVSVGDLENPKSLGVVEGIGDMLALGENGTLFSTAHSVIGHKTPLGGIQVASLDNQCTLAQLVTPTVMLPQFLDPTFTEVVGHKEVPVVLSNCRKAAVTLRMVKDDGQLAVVTGRVDGDKDPRPIENIELPVGLHRIHVRGDLLGAGVIAKRKFVLEAQDREDQNAAVVSLRGKFVSDLANRPVLPLGHTYVRDVNVGRGFLTRRFTDFVIPGRHLDLTMARTFSTSGKASDSAMGGGWSWSYDARVLRRKRDQQTAPQWYEVKLGDGTSISFETSDDRFNDAVFKPAGGYNGELKQRLLAQLVPGTSEAQREITYTDKTGLVYTFKQVESPRKADDEWLLQTIEEPHGDHILLTYDAIGRVKTVDLVQGPRGTAPTYTLNIAYEHRGDFDRIASVSCSALALYMDYEYDDEHGNLLEATRSVQNSNGPRAAAAYRERYAYEPVPAGSDDDDESQADPHQLIRVTDANGNTTEYVYDNARPHLYPLREVGVLEIRQGGTAARVTSFAYQFAGSAVTVQVKDPRGYSTAYELTPIASDVAGNPPSTLLTKITRPVEGAVTTIGWQAGKQRRDWEQDALGRRVTFGYDTRGNVTSETVTAPNLPTLVTQYTYHPRFGKLLSRTEPQPAGDNVTWQLDETTGDVLSMTSYAGTTTYQYEGGLLRAETSPNGNVTQYGNHHPATGRPRTIAHIGTSLVEYREIDARGRVTREWSSNGRRVDTEYDGLDRVTRQARLGPPTMNTAATYYPAGQPKVVTTASGATTSYVLNAFNEITTATTTFVAGAATRTATVTAEYDANGNKAIETDARNVVRRYTYDPLDRLTGVEVVSGPSVAGPVGPVASYTYDAGGNRLTETDVRSAATTQYQYDAYARVVKKTLPDPQYFEEYQYDAIGNRTAVKDVNGRWTNTQHDKLRRPIRVERPEGHVTTVKYDDPEGPNGVSHVNKSEEHEAPRGLRTHYKYDALNREIERRVVLEGPGGGPTYATATAYADGPENSVTVTAPRWTQTTQLDLAGRPRTVFLDPPAGGLGPRIQTDYEYDVAGNKVAVRDGNRNLTVFAYDGLGRLMESTDATETQSTTYDYDAGGLKIQQVDRRGVVTRFAYDNLGRPTETTVEAQPGMSNLAWTQRVQYDDAARARIEYDALNNATRYGYDALGRVATVTDANGDVVTYGWDGLNKRSERDKRGNTTTFEYDGLNRLRKVTDPAPFQAQTVETEYVDAQNQVVVRDRRKVADTVSQLDPLGRVKTVQRGTTVLETNTFDADGNKVLAVDGEGRKTSFEYDHANRLIARTDGYESPAAARTVFRVDANGNVTGEQDARARSGGVEWSVVRNFDVLDRLTSVTDGEGHMTQYGYDAEGHRTAVIDAKGEQTAYTYDELGKLLSAAQPIGTTTYTYDAVRNRIEQKDPKGNVVRMEYDKLGRVEKLVQDREGLNLVTQHHYDPNGNEDLLTDAKGQTVNLAYDELNRLKTKAYAFAPGDNTRPWRHTTGIEYGYDANGNVVQVDETVVTGNNAPQTLRTTRVWDNFDRLTRETATLPDGGGLRSVDYTYYANGARKTVEAGGSVTTYAYDGQNRLKSTTTGDGQRTDYAYHADSLLDTVTYPNGVVGTHLYDRADRLTSLTNTRGGVVSSYVYGYDANGNRLTQTETLGGVSEATAYTYDANDRLKTVRYPADEAFPSGRLVEYGYDLAGNRQTEVTKHPVTGAVLASRTGTFDKINRLLTLTDDLDSTKTLAYTYDANGNQTSKTVGTGQTAVRTDFSYDIRDKLVEAKRGALMNVQYQHDFEGRLVRSFDDQGFKQYLYDGASRLVEYSTIGAVIARYEYGSDRLIRLAHTTEGTRYYSFDGLGSPTALTDTAGAVQAKYHLDAWGIYRKPEQVDDSKNRFGFTGYVYQPLLNLYYANARFYDPEVGRFTSQDSYLGQIDDPPSLHRFTYTANNPTLYVDPSGHAYFSDAEMKQIARDATGATPRRPDYERGWWTNFTEHSFVETTGTMFAPGFKTYQGLKDMSQLGSGSPRMFIEGQVETVIAGAIPLVVKQGAGALVDKFPVLGRNVTDLFGQGVAKIRGLLGSSSGAALEPAISAPSTALARIGPRALVSQRPAVLLPEVQPSARFVGDSSGNVLDLAAGRGRLPITNEGPIPLGSGRRLSRAEYDGLRARTPDQAARDLVNPAGPKIDPVYRYPVERLAADHINSMKVITEVNGFAELSPASQLEVLNLGENIAGLGIRTNASKGAASWGAWRGHRTLGPVPADVRARMLGLQDDAMKSVADKIRQLFGFDPNPQ